MFTTVLCNTIQFIDNWFWDIFHLRLPSGKQASGHTTAKKLQDMPSAEPRNTILARFILMIFFFIPPDKEIWFNNLCKMLQQLMPPFSQESGFIPHQMSAWQRSNHGAINTLRSAATQKQIWSPSPTVCGGGCGVFMSIWIHQKSCTEISALLCTTWKSLNLVKTQQKNLREYVDFLACRS